MYFLFRGTEDGGQVDWMTREELLERLEQNYWGPIEIVSDPAELPGSDPNYWGDKALLVEGKTIKPQPKETVTSWEV
jgi:hypothetical protein